MAKPAHDSITATELVRNLSVVIDKVRISGHSLYITKGSQTIAELNPPPKHGLPIDKLIALLTLDEADKSTFEGNLNDIRNNANLPDNPWES